MLPKWDLGLSLAKASPVIREAVEVLVIAVEAAVFLIIRDKNRKPYSPEEPVYCS